MFTARALGPIACAIQVFLGLLGIYVWFRRRTVWTAVFVILLGFFAGPFGLESMGVVVETLDGRLAW